jgi:hypothetical protein
MQGGCCAGGGMPCRACRWLTSGLREPTSTQKLPCACSRAGTVPWCQGCLSGRMCVCVLTWCKSSMCGALWLGRPQGRGSAQQDHSNRDGSQPCAGVPCSCALQQDGVLVRALACGAVLCCVMQLSCMQLIGCGVWAASVLGTRPPRHTAEHTPAGSCLPGCA